MDLIRYAYGDSFGKVEVTGGPEWIRGRRFDVSAKSEIDHPTRDDFRLMMRTLLADRFGLLLHKDSKEGDVYALAVARDDGKLGPNIQLYDGTCEPTQPSSQTDSEPPRCRAVMNYVGILLWGSPIELFAKMLEGHMDRPVRDRTGLTGRFDIDFQYDFAGLDLAAPGGPEQEFGNSAPSIFTVLQEQLGLKLESAKGEIGYLVVDHAEPPTEN